MVDFKAFRGLRPAQGLTERVAAVPYDVVDTPEARALAEGNPDSLLHVTRPEIDLPDGTDPHSEIVYAQATRAFAALRARGALVEAPAPALYAYALTREGATQLGLIGTASAADYTADRIKKHEHTRPVKELDRTRHIEAVRAHLGPVFLCYRAHAEIDDRLAAIAQAPPEVDFVAHDGVRHRLWPIEAPAQIAALEAAFAQLDALYIADGHHRAAAATRVAGQAPEGAAHAAQRRFLAVAFPHDQLTILPYHRVLGDRNGHTAQSLLAALAQDFTVEALDGPTPAARATEFVLYTEGRWYRLTLRPELLPEDAVARLDVSVLQERVLAPLLAVQDPRTDERIDFVGGVRGLEELARRAGDEGVAIALYATPIEALLQIADEGRVMPPKSTWFEPKLRSGLVISTY